jgi:hypothetical protein
MLSTKIKSLSKATSQLVSDMGTSWYKAFENEFSKEYFQKVSSNSFIIEKKDFFISIVSKFH